MRRVMIAAGLFALVPGAAWAHVTVAPRETKPGVEQQYTVRVPTEGQVATTSVFLEVPEGVTVLDVPVPEGDTHEVKREGTRIVAITWKKEIPPRQRAEFLFKATNPAAEGQIVWKIQQRFADGKSAAWTPGTKVTIAPSAPAARPAERSAAGEQTGGHGGHQASPSTGEVAAIEKWLAEYYAAFNATDLEKLGTLSPRRDHLRGGGVDNGWAAYRDGHLGPELKAFENLQFGHRDINVSILPGGQSAYVRSEYCLKAKMGRARSTLPGWPRTS